MELTLLPGFRDFFPEDTARRDYIFKHWRETANRYGFLPYDGPPLENTDLYRRKSGDEIVAQLYCFTDKGGREISLRPEMTPSLARMIASKGRSISKPIKWFCMPQFFRYERQQRGRLREFYQFNCDILGESSVAADAELIALSIDCLRAFGLTETDFRVHVSDRQLLTALISAVGIEDPHLFTVIFSAVDKLTREPPEKVKAKMVEGGVQPDQADKILSFFKQKDLMDIASAYDSSPAVCERVLTLQRLFGLLEAMGLRNFVEFDISIVRGLAYYTGIVFEAFDCKGDLRAIYGGGRYDQLLKTIGGVDMPAVGFAIGDVVLGELLKERALWPQKLMPPLDVYFILIDETLRQPLLSLAHQLREIGFNVDYSLTESSVSKQLKSASEKEATIAVILGPEEWKQGNLKIKDLKKWEEKEIRIEKIREHLLETLHRK